MTFKIILQKKTDGIKELPLPTSDSQPTTMLSPAAAANRTLDIRDKKVIIPSSEHGEQSVSRSRRLTVLENSSDILELLSDIEDSDLGQDEDQAVSAAESERMGRAAANLMSNIVLSADFRCEI